MATIVPRSGWGARPARSVHRIPTPTPRLWVHHTADDRQGASAVRAHQAFHQGTRGWNDIAYSFLIGDDGTIWEGRGPGVAGGHTAGDNTRSHAICLLGNFDGREPTAQSLDSLVWLARHGQDAGWWTPTLGGHRDAAGAQTACPGRHLYAALPGVRARLTAAGQPTPPPIDLEDDDMKTMRFVQRKDATGGRRNAVYIEQNLEKLHLNTPGALAEARIIFRDQLLSQTIEQWPAHWVDALVAKRPGVDDIYDPAG